MSDHIRRLVERWKRPVNWEAVGAMGEIIGAVVVVITLVYVASEIRQNTRMARAEMTKDLLLASQTAIMELASNDRLAELYADIRPFEDEASARRHTFYQSFFRLYELQFNLAEQGLVAEDVATSYELVIRMWAQTRHFDAYWSVARDEFHEDFVAYVDEQIRATRAPEADDTSTTAIPSAPVEIQLAMDIADADEYSKYRRAIAPVLDRYGGRVMHEFRVSEVVQSDSDVPVNRVATIRFPNRRAREAFFADPQYLAARQLHFEAAVRSSDRLAEYER